MIDATIYVTQLFRPYLHKTLAVQYLISSLTLWIHSTDLSKYNLFPQTWAEVASLPQSDIWHPGDGAIFHPLTQRDSRDLKPRRDAGCREVQGRYKQFSVLLGSFVCVLGGRLSRLAPFCAICQDGACLSHQMRASVWWHRLTCSTYIFTAHHPSKFANIWTLIGCRSATDTTLQVKLIFWGKKKKRTSSFFFSPSHSWWPFKIVLPFYYIMFVDRSLTFHISTFLHYLPAPNTIWAITSKSSLSSILNAQLLQR